MVQKKINITNKFLRYFPLILLYFSVIGGVNRVINNRILDFFTFIMRYIEFR